MASEAPQSTTCDERVGNGVVTYSCSLERGHAGPHLAVEVASSRRARDRWEREQRHAASGLGEFQGVAETTAERYTENPTPVPGERDFAGVPALSQDAALARREAEKAATVEVQALGDVMNAVDARKRRVRAAEDGLEVLYRDEHIVLKALPDGAYMVEHPDGLVGERVAPTWIDVTEVTDDLAEDHAEFDRAFEGVPTKQREGDQRLPDLNGMRDAQSQMVEDILERRSVGVSRYGTALQPFNGRNTVLDLYEELLDAAVYARTLLTMREATRDMLVEQAMEALDGMLPRIAGRTTENYRREVAEKVVERLLDALVQRG